MIKITGFTVHQTAEGKRVAFTVSEIDENGNLVQSNARGTVICLDENICDCITDIENWLLDKVTAQLVAIHQ
ncbi:MAG: hypothetical protein IKD75_01760 [Prevotella sp.]|nr:hypothetical protein [Prevotella sp.]